MNSVQYISSRVERVIGNAQQTQLQQQQQQEEQEQEQQQEQQCEFASKANISLPVSPLAALATVSTNSASIKSPAQFGDGLVASVAANTNGSGVDDSPVTAFVNVGVDQSKNANEAWFWILPFSWIIKIFHYILRLLGYTFGAIGHDDVDSTNNKVGQILFNNNVTNSGDNSFIPVQGQLSVEDSSILSPQVSDWPQIKSSHQHLVGADSRLPPSIYQGLPFNQSSSPLSEKYEEQNLNQDQQQRSVRIRLARKGTEKDKPFHSRDQSVEFNTASIELQRSIKSPTSPGFVSSKATKYPRIPPPPRPLIPKHVSPKTLILDLDETLIHSLSKGGKMSSGHMVEVKLEKQHAILYYVHKRPFCDEFLKKVSKWYNLVIFTASVQEYADPVIDWLEQNRKYFKARYYRQHCTFRNGGYVKDITVVEPDLSKVMIIDNSPISYLLHEDNAIAIEGWINDPSDLDLLHLIPFLNGMRYVTDVRTLISLRMGNNAFALESF
ncbi:NLI interacting factor-like phosphatase-domain-containing protein [Lipomyces japonicus]|uniref:NLI interacting factor-like phosphatase-domain-containing protein n=1 Tax=Lipomyces japonicus TaxID=56871 RepID=UPI0034CD251F